MRVERIEAAARGRLATLRAEALVTEAANLLREARINLVVVCDGGGVMVGVITKTDVVRHVAYCGGDVRATTVAALMNPAVTFCRPSEDLRVVWERMKAQRRVHIPVIDPEARPWGVVSARDVLLALLEEAEYEEALLRDYVMGIGYH